MSSTSLVMQISYVTTDYKENHILHHLKVIF
jgi:hypothetical protein